MGSIKHILSLLLLLACTKAFAAADTILQPKTVINIAGSYTNFYMDNLGNTYLLNINNQVKKLDDKYDSAGVFNDIRRYGDIFSLDVSNPLKIVLYYRDFNTILVLDRFLNTRNTIDLRKAGIQQAKAVAQSYDNNYWVFDELDNKIKKLDDNGNVLMESADFRVLFSETYNPTQIIDNDGLLYLYDADNGWLVFDYYGALKQRVQLNGWKNVQVNNKILQGWDKSGLYFANPAVLSVEQLKTSIPLTGVIKLQKTSNRLYALTKQGLSIYSL